MDPVDKTVIEYIESKGCHRTTTAATYLPEEIWR